ncbi:MAG: hypothetical protein V9E89_03060 [Ilumatobacteraceae bacterium]
MANVAGSARGDVGLVGRKQADRLDHIDEPPGGVLLCVGRRRHCHTLCPVLVDGTGERALRRQQHDARPAGSQGDPQFGQDREQAVVDVRLLVQRCGGPIEQFAAIAESLLATQPVIDGPQHHHEHQGHHHEPRRLHPQVDGLHRHTAVPQRADRAGPQRPQRGLLAMPGCQASDHANREVAEQPHGQSAGHRPQTGTCREMVVTPQDGEHPHPQQRPDQFLSEVEDQLDGRRALDDGNDPGPEGQTDRDGHGFPEQQGDDEGQIRHHERERGRARGVQLHPDRPTDDEQADDELPRPRRGARRMEKRQGDDPPGRANDADRQSEDPRSGARTGEHVRGHSLPDRTDPISSCQPADMTGRCLTS